MTYNSLIEINNTYFKYWEEAGEFCVSRIFDFAEYSGEKDVQSVVSDIIQNSSLSSNEYLSKITFDCTDDISLMKSIIDQYIESGLVMQDIQNNESNRKLLEVHQFMFLLMSNSAINIFKFLNNHPQYSKIMNMHLSEIYISDTVAKKQRDYGPNNIAKFGIFGLILRIHDKIARLENLLSSKRKGINSVKGETIFDTLFDIIGYSTVAMMWINGWFFNPMEYDSNE